MPLLFLTGLVFGLLPFLLLGWGGYLAWSWYEGTVVAGADGGLQRLREDWRLWTALALLSWSFLGRFVVPLLLARPDVDPTRAERGAGTMIKGAGDASLYVESHGDPAAPPLILVHGWGLDSTIWYYAKRHLAQRFHVTIWDLPGLGRSTALSGRAVDLASFAVDRPSPGRSQMVT